MEHSIFISYAWVDNEIFPGADQGWVSTFVDGLRKHVARELGRRDEAERLWLDYEQMRGNDSVTPSIRTQLDASLTLILFLSNGYLASTWCRQELETFVGKFGTDCGRIFVVEMSPVDGEPPALRDLVRYKFWYLDERKQPCTRWFPHIDPTDRQYSPEQQKLARDLATKLRELQCLGHPEHHVPLEHGREFAELPAGKTSWVREPREHAPLQGAAERFVLVDGGVEDRDLIHEIAERLGQHNLSVATPLSAEADQSGIKSSTLTRDLRAKLSLCDSVLMVYRSGPVDQVSQHLVECLKARTRAENDQTPPTIHLCQTQTDSLSLGLRPAGMRIRQVHEPCVNECVEWFLEGVGA